MIYISKIDAEHADFYKVFEELKAEYDTLSEKLEEMRENFTRKLEASDE